MTRFQLSCRCTSCGLKFRRVIEAESEADIVYGQAPPCPTCARGQKSKVAKFDFHSRKAPAAGGSLRVRAIDTTAQIVMEDYGMSDLKDRVYEGETAAPKLPPKLQTMADNMFARPKSPRRQQLGGIFGLPTQAVIKAAVGGRYMTPDTAQPIAEHHKRRDKAATIFVAGDGIKPTGS